MLTFLWMLYLASLLFLTHATVMNTFSIIKYTHSAFNSNQRHTHNFIKYITCIMWAIWYMYFLH